MNFCCDEKNCFSFQPPKISQVVSCGVALASHHVKQRSSTMVCGGNIPIVRVSNVFPLVLLVHHFFLVRRVCVSCDHKNGAKTRNSSQLYSMPMDNDFKFYQAINTRRWDARRRRISALRWSCATCFSRRAENSQRRRNRLNSGLDEIGRGSQMELRKGLSDDGNCVTIKFERK